MNSTHLKHTIVAFILTFPLALNLKAETKKDTLSDLDRTFMPAVQLGYVFNGTSQLSGGLNTQTSIEYRDITNLVFRLNYDVFNTIMNTTYPINRNISFTGKTSFSELLLGIGYRNKFSKHSFTAMIQPGLRFYGYPLFTTDSTQIHLNYDTRKIGAIRYSLGYEYAIAPKLFLSIEGLIGHTFQSKDFWSDNRYYYGITIGLSAPII